MRGVFISGVLWLGCTVAGVAIAQPNWLERGETLYYDVAWGPLTVGQAVLAFTPEKDGQYAIEARVKDESMFIDLDDKWRVEGNRKGNKWQSEVYSALQKENDYRADKLVKFDNRQAVYENRIGREPSLKVSLPPETLDVFSALYSLRAQGLDSIHQPRRMEVMGLKKVFPLDIAVPVAEKHGDQTVWRVDLIGHNMSTKRKGDQHWSIWLEDGADLIPVRIEAQLKFGTFVATMRN